MKILIVDDRKENLYLLEILLKSSSYEVVSAKNGIEALERLREDSIDMIISDILMPKMDGFQLCRECKKDESLRKIPFIFYTATYIEEKDKEFALSLGAEKFILKPKEPDEFIKIIQGVVKDVKEKKIELKKRVLEEEKEVLKLYNERLVNKLEKKVLDLEKEITERKKAEEKIYKANRLYSVLSQVNQSIVREQDKQKLFQEICNIAIEYGKFKLAWVGFVDEKTKLVKPVAFSGKGSDYLKNIKISISDELTGKCPTGRAILEKRSVIFNDLENNPDYKPWREQAFEKGYRSSAAFPLRLYDNVIGTLNIYAVEPDFFDKDEIKLLEETALDISFALEKFEEEDKRLEIEKELKMERNNLLNILESMKEGVYIIDQEYKLQYVNSYLQKGFGLFRGQKCFKYLYDRKKICPWCKNKDVIKGKTIRQEWFSDKDGRTYDIIDTPLKNIDGSIFKLSILRNITDRKKAEESLQTSEKQLQTLIDAMPDFVCFKDGDGRWLKVNDAAIRVFQLEGIDYRGKKDSELAELNSHLRNTFLTCKESDAKVWEEGGLIHGEETVPDSNGSIRVFDVIKVPVSHSDGTRKGIVIIGYDITERKRAEEELKKHQDHLEELVKERTKELEEKNKELKRFNKLFVGREFRIKELKDKVKELEKIVNRLSKV